MSADTRAIFGTPRALVSIIDSMAYEPTCSMLHRSFKISSYVLVSCLHPTTTARTCSVFMCNDLYKTLAHDSEVSAALLPFP